MARRIASPHVIERAAEISALDRVLASAADGRAGIGVVLGEAGVGKSRLVAELEGRARARDMLVLRGAGVDLEGTELPYAPLAAALRDVPPAFLADAAAALPPLGRTELARAFPHLLDAEHAPAGEHVDGYAQARLFEFLLALLRALARDAALVLVLEDFHWADRSTRDAVSFLIRNVRDDAIAVVITCRDDELPREHPVRRSLAELTRHERAECLKLEGLTLDGVREQVRSILGRPAPDALVEAVHAQSGGNPFFVEEVLASDTAMPGARVPEPLADLVLARFRRLTDDGRQLVRAMAVIGRRSIGCEPLELVSGLAGARLNAALREAIERHILTTTVGGDGFAFRHAIVRAAVHEELMPGERTALHAAAARALEASGDAGDAELAAHWREAGDLPRALAASARAGVQAMGARAAAEALAHFGHAIDCRRRLGAMPPQAPLDGVDLLVACAEAARACGDYEQATGRCDEALAELDVATAPERAARLLELRGLSQSWSAPDAALESLREAETLLGPERAAERTRVLGAQGFALANRFRWAEAKERCEAALATGAGAPGETGPAGDAGAPGGAAGEGDEAFARMVLGLALAFLGDPDAGEKELVRARDAAARLDRPEDLMRSHLYLGEVLRLDGRIREAAELMRDGARAATRVGMEGSFGRYMLVNAADDCFALGRWDECAELLARTADVELAPWTLLLRHIVAGRLATARGELDTAAATLDRARVLCGEEEEAVDFAISLTAARAELAIWQNRPQDACRLAIDALDVVETLADVLDAPALLWLGARAAADAAEAARTSADRRAEQSAIRWAQQCLAALDALLERTARPRVPPAACAYRDACAAEALRAPGAADPAAWRAAVTAWDRCELPYPAAYARWRAAEATLTGASGRAAATRELERARSAAAGLGAHPLRSEIEALARRARIALEVPAAGSGPAEAADPVDRSAAAAALGLTPREIEVLALLGRGMSNRQIGEALFISQKTAGVHVSHIFAKLDVHSRVAAARAADRLGLADDAPDEPRIVRVPAGAPR